MAKEVARNRWGVVLHHAPDDILELRWLPGQMSDTAFKATLELLALEAEKRRPWAILVEATQSKGQCALGEMEPRNGCIIPGYSAAGVKKLGLCVAAEVRDDFSAAQVWRRYSWVMGSPEWATAKR